MALFFWKWKNIPPQKKKKNPHDTEDTFIFLSHQFIQLTVIAELLWTNTVLGIEDTKLNGTMRSPSIVL